MKVELESTLSSSLNNVYRKRGFPSFTSPHGYGDFDGKGRSRLIVVEVRQKDVRNWAKL